MLYTKRLKTEIKSSVHFRLKDEMNRLQENLVENQQLNNTLQLELSVYDKMHDENKTKSRLNLFFVFERK